MFCLPARALRNTRDSLVFTTGCRAVSRARICLPRVPTNCACQVTFGESRATEQTHMARYVISSIRVRSGGLISSCHHYRSTARANCVEPREVKKKGEKKRNKKKAARSRARLLFAQSSCDDPESRLHNARVHFIASLREPLPRPCRISPPVRVRCAPSTTHVSSSRNHRDVSHAVSPARSLARSLVSLSAERDREKERRARISPPYVRSKLYRAQGQRVFVGTSRPNCP